jgi:hypothetical protein
MPFTWPAKAAQPMVFPIFANTARHTNFGEACGQFRWGHPNDDAAIPHSRSFPRLLHFWSKIRRRGNGKAQWSDKVTMYQGARQKLLGTSTKADASGALSPKWSYASVLVIKSPIQFHMVSSIAHVKSCADLKILFWWLLHLSCSELQPLRRVLKGLHKVLSAWEHSARRKSDRLESQFLCASGDALLNGTILLCNIMPTWSAESTPMIQMVRCFSLSSSQADLMCPIGSSLQQHPTSLPSH